MQRHKDERDLVYDGLRLRAKMITEKLNKNPYISCSEIEGAMYAFPTIKLTEKIVNAGIAAGKQPDLVYCIKMLEETGIMTVPGSGFVQR